MYQYLYFIIEHIVTNCNNSIQRDIHVNLVDHGGHQMSCDSMKIVLFAKNKIETVKSINTEQDITSKG